MLAHDLEMGLVINKLNKANTPRVISMEFFASDPMSKEQTYRMLMLYSVGNYSFTIFTKYFNKEEK